MTRGWLGAALALLAALVPAAAGPVGAGAAGNATSSEPAAVTAPPGGCLVEGRAYAAGGAVPGAGCQRCRCERGEVACRPQRCAARPGCKALHRPDQCCPVYQCECELEGRVYANGEKLVDPLDPCRVCYCQGGEVVCRRIACFLRDDCRPRAVPGRCCPEYDNCPIRGVSALPGAAVSASSMSAVADLSTSPAPPTSKPNMKQEITIKEITPVSEIPVITEVKIKEILPSPGIDITEYSSSKSPLIPRETTSENIASKDIDLKTEAPAVSEAAASTLSVSISELPPDAAANFSPSNIDSKMEHSSPAKINVPMHDTKKEQLDVPMLSTMGTSVSSDNLPNFKTTKSPLVIEDEDALFDHNPAFPPLPDDLSVAGNHDDENLDPNVDGVHITSDQDDSINIVSTKEPIVTTLKSDGAPTEKVLGVSSEPVTAKTEKTTESTHLKQSSMLNLRSAISTEILDLPSSLPEDITGELDETVESATTTNKMKIILPETFASSTAKNSYRTNIDNVGSNTRSTEIPTTRFFGPEDLQNQSVQAVVRSDDATEVTLQAELTSQTELSSLPIETSDQKPHDTTTNDTTTIISSSSSPAVIEAASTKVLDASTAVATEDVNSDRTETTESVPTYTSSSEIVTDAVEFSKLSPEAKHNEAMMESVNNRKNNVLTDLMNIVGDVEAIGKSTSEPEVLSHVISSTGVSESEELTPVNAGYKSKNKNFNVNSITEMPVKSKPAPPTNKQKIVEIDDDETVIADSPPPHDNVEPTTSRPIIDHVSDDAPENRTEKKDIEIIIKSYVPTINRRPTKVVMKPEEAPASPAPRTEGPAAAQ